MYNGRLEQSKYDDDEHHDMVIIIIKNIIKNMMMIIHLELLHDKGDEIRKNGEQVNLSHRYDDDD